MRPWLAAIGAAAIVAFTFWLSGFDFDKRGVATGVAFIYSIGAGAIAFVFAKI